MQFVLKTHYRVEFLPLVITFVSETARCLGAAQKEIAELGMAVEEAALFIIEHYPGDGLAAQFEVQCEVCPDGLRVVLSNLGLPVNLQALTRYEAGKAEETIEGLGHFLIERLVDHYEFVNQGRAGWRTVLLKRLAQLKMPEPTAGTEADALAPSQERLQIVEAGVEHVPGIVELAYCNYGYSYSKDVFYYADKLRAALLQGRIRSFIALNPAGQVVGQMAIQYSDESPEVAEVGAVMVRPEYRRSRGLLQLIKAVIHRVRDQADAPVIGEVNLVTTHILSQKACALFDFKPMALKLSIHDRARFLKLAEEAAAQRESLLHAVYVTRLMNPVRLFVPPRQMEITRRLFANAGIGLELPAPAGGLPAQTALACDSHPDAALAVLSLPAPGLDFAAALRARLFDLEAEGMKTVYIRFPGWQPLPPDLEEQARALRIFFCGWVVEAPDRWWLLYARLNAQRFDFDRIQLCDPFAMELRTYVETCYREAVL